MLKPNEKSNRPEDNARTAPDKSAIRFEAIEPRILLSGENSLVMLSVEGEISVPGETDQYEFVLDQSRRVVFDTLKNTSGISWTLEGPDGQVSITANSSVKDLPEGTYRLKFDGSGDTTGEYALRVLDANGAEDMTPGERVDVSLEGGNTSTLYRFSANAGDKYYFDSISFSEGAVYYSCNWYLIDPYGRLENYNSIRSDADTFSLKYSGEYLLLLAGNDNNSATIDYSFNLLPVVDPDVRTLALDTVTTATIGQVGQVSTFDFSLAESTPVLFDSLGEYTFYWTLTGPDNFSISRSHGHTTGAGLAGSNDGWLLLPPGDYSLSIDPAGLDATGDYPFRLLSGASAQTLSLGETAAGTLDYARGIKLYKLDLMAGDEIFFESHSLSAGTLYWSLVDPYGVKAGSGNDALMTQADSLTVAASGEHWLILDGYYSNNINATLDYAFAVHRAAAAHPLILGDVVTNDASLPGPAIYEFELAAATQLAFDSLTNRSNLVWSLTGPRGAEVTNRSFSSSDGSTPSALSLPAGKYRLTVQGYRAATGDYAFRLLDLSSAQSFSLDTALTGTLSPGNSTQAFRVDLAAGDKIAFQSNSVTSASSNNVYWRLVDRFGVDVAGYNSLRNNRAAFTLTAGGTYTLLIEGALANAADIAFDVQFNYAGNDPQVLPEGEALAFGETLTGTLASTESRVWRFTLDADKLLVMDSLLQTVGNARWTLQGPRGVEINGRAFTSNTLSYCNPVLSLPAGEYALTLQGGDYAFRLLDATAFPQLELGRQYTVARTPDNSILGYRFDALAGDMLALPWSGSSTTWRLVDPLGREIPANGSYGASWDIALDGVYTLLCESSSYASVGDGEITFTLRNRSQDAAELVFNDTIQIALDGYGDVAEYTFTLDTDTALVFDALDTWYGKEDGVEWRLTRLDGSGVEFGWRHPGSYLYGYAYGGYSLKPGQYKLSVRNTQDAATAFQFRVLNRDVAIGFTPGETVDDSFPAGESRLYRFNAEAGEHFYFDGQAESNYWYLYDPAGRRVTRGLRHSRLPGHRPGHGWRIHAACHGREL